MPRFLAFLAAILLLSAPARADREHIERVLAKMQAAVAAADVDAYMTNVSRSDPIFHKEQFNWAKDLNRRPVTTIGFAIAEPAEGQKEEFGPSSARFELEIKWTMEPEREGGRPIDRTLSFPVVFTLDDSGRWVFAGEDWVTIEGGAAPTRPGRGAPLNWVRGKPLVRASSDNSGRPGPARSSDGGGGTSERRTRPAADLNATPARPRDIRFQGPADSPPLPPATAEQRRVRVKFFPGFEDVAARIVQVLPDVREHVDEGFSARIDRVQEVKLYPTMRHLQESIYLSYTDGLSGWNEPGESIKLLANPNSSASRLRSLLAHEYGHVATFECGPKANDMPWWILEGVAELSSERFVGAGGGRDADSAVISWHNADRLADWNDLADFHVIQASTQRDLQRQVYKQGQHMVGYVSDRFGRDARNRWLRAMSQGAPIEDASRQTLGLSFTELDEQWRAAVKDLADKDAAAKAAKAEAEKAAAPSPEPAKPN